MADDGDKQVARAAPAVSSEQRGAALHQRRSDRRATVGNGAMVQDATRSSSGPNTSSPALGNGAPAQRAARRHPNVSMGVLDIDGFVSVLGWVYGSKTGVMIVRELGRGFFEGVQEELEDDAERQEKSKPGSKLALEVGGPLLFEGSRLYRPVRAAENDPLQFWSGVWDGIQKGLAFQIQGFVDMAMLIAQVPKMLDLVARQWVTGELKKKWEALKKRLEGARDKLRATMFALAADPVKLAAAVELVGDQLREAGRSAVRRFHAALDQTTAHDVGVGVGFVLGAVLFEVALSMVTAGIGILIKQIVGLLGRIGKAIASAVAEAFGAAIRMAARLFGELIDAIRALARSFSKVKELSEGLEETAVVISDLEKFFQELGRVGVEAATHGEEGGALKKGVTSFLDETPDEMEQGAKVLGKTEDDVKKGADLLKSGEHTEGAGTPPKSTEPPAIKLGERLDGGTSGNKDVYAIVGEPDRVIAILKPGKPTAVLKREIDALRLLEEQGVPAVKVLGTTTHDGRPAMVLERKAVGTKPIVRRTRGQMVLHDDPAAKDAARFLNQKSVEDLHKIGRMLDEKRLKVDDLQFLIGEDGSVVINDPINLISGEGPSNANKRMIQLLIKAARENVKKAGLL
jgi:hypothetical protein